MCCVKNAISISEQTYLRLGNNFYFIISESGYFYYFCRIILVYFTTHEGNDIFKYMKRGGS
jgi:hypothetical protein